MQDFTKETDARIIIDELLRQAGWDPADKSQVRTEVGTGDGGRADYVLHSRQGRALAVIEAKRNAFEPYRAKQQALPYAKQLQAPFIFLTNGELIYFWDYTNDDARVVNSFYSRRDLERVVELREQRQPLAAVAVPEVYTRNSEPRLVRPYQQECMKAIDHAVELGKRRFLIELPTGTGKTDLICLQLKRLIQAGRAERILFLVDRDQLAKQALEALQDLLDQYGSYWLRPGVERQEKQITVCLLQTMIGRYQDFTSGYFDVVVADECHRSIYGAWQTSLTHFDALHVGLTATPAMYIERNTYRFYQCKDNRPDFTFRIQDAFRDEYLVPYRFASGITRFLEEGVEHDVEHLEPAEFERAWTNTSTNELMMREFDRLAWENYRELAPKQKLGPGKAIVFAITKHHATRLAQYLNQLHPEHKGRYAEVITSDVPNAEEIIRKFKRDDYPMVAVSVDMLTTGFDCREVLHLVLCRRVRSPILYQQIRGRGTRTAPHIGKKKFVIYDFFKNHEHFNDSDTDIFVATASGSIRSGGGGRPPAESKELIELGQEDEWFQAVSYVELGPEGERVDNKQYITNWEQAIQNAADDDAVIRKIRNDQPLSEDEEVDLADRLNRPEMYFNEDNLRKAYQQPAGNLIDFIRAALGTFKLKSREEQLTESFQAWMVAKGLSPQQAQFLALVKNRGVAKGKVGLSDLFQPPLSILDAAGLGVELFGEKGLREIIEDLNDAVFARRPERTL